MAAQHVTPLFYSTTEAAKVLGMSQNAVLRLCREGTLRAERIGRVP